MTSVSAPPLNVGLVGAGKMGALHLEKLARLASVEIVGLFDPNRATANSVASARGTRAFDRLADLLFECDAVVIAAPTALHYPLARQALEAGLHALVEKPLCETVEHAQHLVSLARDAGLVLQTGLLERYRWRELASMAPPLAPLKVEARRASPYLGRKDTGDVIADLMIHDLDLLVAVVPDEPIGCLAEGMMTTGPGWDTVRAEIFFPSGRSAVIEADRVAAERAREVRLAAESASLRFDLLRDEVSWEGTFYGKASRRIDALYEQARDFVECVTTRRAPLVTPADALRSLRLAERIRAALGGDVTTATKAQEEAPRVAAE